MVKKAVFLILCILLGAGCASLPAVTPQLPRIGAIEPIKKTDRILIIAPHPDDETIGCAGVIQEAVSKGATLKVVYLTNGDHNQVAFIVYEKRFTLRRGEFIHMGEVRRNEAVKAMKVLGINSNNLIFLGYPDFGTFSIFREVWHSTQPYRSLLTRISSVPYRENFSFGAPYMGESILADFEKILKEYKPNKIFVSHPADTNVDHRAGYLFLQIALRDLAGQIRRPKIYPYLIHCLGWPLPRHYHPQLDLEPPRQFSGSQMQWSKLSLTPEQVNKKHQALLCYKSQTSSSAFYLLSFVRKNELFGDYPEIELKRQSSGKNRQAAFSGFSNMFVEAGMTTPVTKFSNITQVKGQVSYGVLDNNLLVRIDKPRKLGARFSVQLYLFGFNDKIPFSSMPKIRIVTKHKTIRVFDSRRLIKAEGVGIEIGANEAIVKVPLRILGNPDFILSAVKTYTGALHIDTASFRDIEIR